MKGSIAHKGSKDPCFCRWNLQCPKPRLVMNKQTMPRASNIFYMLSDLPTLPSAPYTHHPTSIFSLSPFPILKESWLPISGENRLQSLSLPTSKGEGEITNGWEHRRTGGTRSGRHFTENDNAFYFLNFEIWLPFPITHIKKKGGGGGGGELSQVYSGPYFA